MTIRRFRGIYVYRCFDANDRLLYVGVSGDVATRFLSGHRRSALWFDDMARYALVGPFTDRAAAEAHERHLIRTERPLHNVMNNGPRRDERPYPAIDELHAATALTGVPQGSLLKAYRKGALAGFTRDDLVAWLDSLATERTA